MGLFNLVSSYSPTGDQPAAIDALSKGLLDMLVLLEMLD